MWTLWRTDKYCTMGKYKVSSMIFFASDTVLNKWFWYMFFIRKLQTLHFKLFEASFRLHRVLELISEGFWSTLIDLSEKNKNTTHPIANSSFSMFCSQIYSRDSRHGNETFDWRMDSDNFRTYVALLAAASVFFYASYDIPDADTECANHGSICNVKSPWKNFPFELALCTDLISEWII